MTVSGIIFDFDGVLVDSVSVKTDAFRELFIGEKQHLAAILDFHRSNGGMSRFVKFEYIYREILRKDLSDQRARELGDQFSRLVKQKVIDCPAMPGALDFIHKYHLRLPFFVASATPQDELLEIVSTRGLAPFFREICGSPGIKSEIIRDILHRNGLTAGNVPFVGDAINDYEAALETGSPFIAFSPNGEWDPFPPPVIRIRTFQELEQHLFEA